MYYFPDTYGLTTESMKIEGLTVQLFLCFISPETPLSKIQMKIVSIMFDYYFVYGFGVGSFMYIYYVIKSGVLKFTDLTLYCLNFIFLV